MQNRRIPVKKGYQGSRGECHDDGDADQYADTHEHRLSDAFSGTLYILRAEVLSHEGGRRLAHALGRQDRELVDLRVAAPARHNDRGTKTVDICLYQSIGKRCESLLDTGRKSDPEDLTETCFIDM